MTAHDGQSRVLFCVLYYKQQGWIAKYDPETNSSFGKISTHVDTVVLDTPNTQCVLASQGSCSLPQTVSINKAVLLLIPKRCRSFSAKEEDHDITLAPPQGPRLFNFAKANPPSPSTHGARRPGSREEAEGN